MLPPQFDVKVFGVACSAAARAVWLYLQECEALFVFEKVCRVGVSRSVGVGVCVDVLVFVYTCMRNMCVCVCVCVCVCDVHLLVLVRAFSYVLFCQYCCGFI